MLQLIGRWILRGALATIVLVAATYAADWLAYKAEGSPQSTVQVSRTMVVPLKNNKTEYDYVGTFDEPCSISLFPQGGLSPCWRLRKNPHEDVNI